MLTVLRNIDTLPYEDNSNGNDSYLAKILNLKEEYDSFYFHGECYTIINILQCTQYIRLHKLNLIIHREKIKLIKNK